MPAPLSFARSASFRFALPPSLGEEAARDRAAGLTRYLTKAIGHFTEVSVAKSYDSLCKDLLAGRVDAAWAPPFVCARVEAMGMRVSMRGVRGGTATYRAAIVARRDAGLTLAKLPGLTAIWVDRDSVGGYLLAAAYLKANGLDPQKAFCAHGFAGSYKAALEAVLAKQADVTSIFASSASAKVQRVGFVEVLPDAAQEFEVVAYTDEAPNDGVVVSMTADPGTVQALEQALAALSTTPDGQGLLKEIFSAEKFEPAPRMSYRALYRVALATL